jgi:hypothetical protein
MVTHRESSFSDLFIVSGWAGKAIKVN